jgi:hypothetical protein
MFPENKTREAIYSTPLTGEVGKLGRYYQAKPPAALDARLGHFMGLPQFLYSQASCDFVEVVKWGRDVAETSAITVTVTATRGADVGGAATGTWDDYQLSTGADVTVDRPWAIPNPDSEVLLALDAFSSGRASRQLYIDLGQDAGLIKPLYGETVAPLMSVVSDDEKFRGFLAYNRTLILWTPGSVWQPLEEDDEVTDTFTIGAFTGGLDNFPRYSPWLFIDPANRRPTGISPTPTYADWPERYPDGVGVLPDAEAPDPVSNLIVPEGYDPYLRRVPGYDAAGVALDDEDPLYTSDQRLGLQLATVRILTGCGGGSSSGGCC